ncbi:MAG: hypothetical protein IH991_08430 [Planctomycetes bacterium]|nr:hypothetical protein [Planctomycetota bacterium]
MEGDDWADPEFDSHLLTRVHRLRHKPIGEFTIEDLRVTIGQSVGLPYLVPLAVNQLERDPLIEGDYFPGDLLLNVLRIADSFWHSHAALRDRVHPVAQLVRERTDDSKILETCLEFLSRWKS